MNDDRLFANYSFVEGEYITSMTLYSGQGLPGFSFTTTVQMYPHILGIGGSLMPLATGQRVLFMSGGLYEFSGNMMVSRVWIYFDTC